MVDTQRAGGQTVALLVAGYQPTDAIEDQERGVHPWRDEILLERAVDAQVLDFTIADEALANSKVLRKLNDLGVGRIWILGFLAARASRDFRAVYATGEDIAIPYSIFSSLFRRTTKLVMRVEDIERGRSTARRALFRLLFRRAVRRSDAILCRTTAHVDALSPISGSRGHVRLVAESVDGEFFSPENASGSLPENITLRDRPLIVSAGLEHRDYPTLLDAIDGLDVDVVIGAGSPWSTDRFDPGRSEPPANVHVDRFGHCEMRDLFSRADLVVVPVRATTRACGITVVLEASAMERPVVCTGTDGLATYVEDNVSALTAPPGDAKALRGAIERALGDQALCGQLAAQARENVRTRFDQRFFIDAVAEELTND